MREIKVELTKILFLAPKCEIIFVPSKCSFLDFLYCSLYSFPLIFTTAFKCNAERQIFLLGRAITIWEQFTKPIQKLFHILGEPIIFALTVVWVHHAYFSLICHFLFKPTQNLCPSQFLLIRSKSTTHNS